MLEIKPLFGTGNNWDNSQNWADSYEPELNDPTTGFKLFSVASFNPGQEYTLTINPGSLSYQSVNHPINVYLFTLDSTLKALFWKLMYGQIDLMEFRQNIMPILKSGSWAARLPATGGDFTLKPYSGRTIGLIDVKLSGETYAKTAIFDYTQGNDTGVFTLVGP